MKTKMSKISWMTVSLVLAVLVPITAHAQRETAPDEYKADNMARIEALSAKSELQGRFSLPYKVQYQLHKLEPGDYTLVVKDTARRHEDGAVPAERK